METIWVATPSGVDIAVHCLGGKGQILLFAPANGFHGRCYEAVVRELASLGCLNVHLQILTPSHSAGIRAAPTLRVLGHW